MNTLAARFLGAVNLCLMALTFGVAATGVAQAQDNGAFAFEVSGDLIPDTSPANPQGRVFKFNIPAGKRLVIERMT
ncbi:MAG TPA: hypothetical protein VE961_16030, partial [Pyrinomonadaceae bacterium]|nr:hypothetical protein [Pyrinomonadaceae bacterium]